MPQATGWHEGLPTSPRGRSALGETVAAGSGQRGASQVSVRQTLFNRKLADWLVFYNAERSHHSLSQQSPLSFLLQHQPKCQRYWTHTDFLDHTPDRRLNNAIQRADKTFGPVLGTPLRTN
jgi:hypothetical protein